MWHADLSLHILRLATGQSLAYMQLRAARCAALELMATTRVIWRTQTRHTTLSSLRQPKAPLKRIDRFYDSVCSFLLSYLHELICLAYCFRRCFYFFIYRPVLPPSLVRISPYSSQILICLGFLLGQKPLHVLYYYSVYQIQCLLLWLYCLTCVMPTCIKRESCRVYKRYMLDISWGEHYEIIYNLWFLSDLWYTVSFMRYYNTEQNSAAYESHDYHLHFIAHMLDILSHKASPHSYTLILKMSFIYSYKDI